MKPSHRSYHPQHAITVETIKYPTIYLTMCFVFLASLLVWCWNIGLIYGQEHTVIQDNLFPPESVCRLSTTFINPLITSSKKSDIRKKARSGCTATYIGNRTFLTAAHCLVHDFSKPKEEESGKPNNKKKEKQKKESEKKPSTNSKKTDHPLKKNTVKKPQKKPIWGIPVYVDITCSQYTTGANADDIDTDDFSSPQSDIIRRVFHISAGSLPSALGLEIVASTDFSKEKLAKAKDLLRELDILHPIDYIIHPKSGIDVALFRSNIDPPIPPARLPKSRQHAHALLNHPQHCLGTLHRNDHPQVSRIQFLSKNQKKAKTSYSYRFRNTLLSLQKSLYLHAVTDRWVWRGDSGGGFMCFDTHSNMAPTVLGVLSSVSLFKHNLENLTWLDGSQMDRAMRILNITNLLHEKTFPWIQTQMKKIESGLRLNDSNIANRWWFPLGPKHETFLLDKMIEVNRAHAKRKEKKEPIEIDPFSDF